MVKQFTRIKVTRKKNQKLSWLNTDLLKLMKETRFVLKTALKSKQANDIHTFIMLQSKAITEIRKAMENFLYHYGG